MNRATDIFQRLTFKLMLGEVRVFGTGFIVLQTHSVSIKVTESDYIYYSGTKEVMELPITQGLNIIGGRRKG